MQEQLRSPNLQTVGEFAEALAKVQQLAAVAERHIREEVASWPEHWWALLSLHARLKTRGRPRGSSTYSTADDFLQTVRPIIQRLKNEGRYPSQARVADLLPLRTSVRQLQRWGKTYRFTWSDVLKSA